MLAAFSVTPIGVGGSLGDQVAEAVRIVRQSGLPSETNALFTNIEGEWDEVMDVIKQCTERLAEMAPRVSVMIKLDVRAGMPAGELVARTERIEHRLNG